MWNMHKYKKYGFCFWLVIATLVAACISTASAQEDRQVCEDLRASNNYVAAAQCYLSLTPADNWWAADSYGWAGNIAYNQGDYNAALNYYLLEIQYADLTTDYKIKGEANYHTGQASYKLGNLEDSKNYYLQAADDYIQLPDDWWAADSYGWAGNIAYEQKDYKNAIDFFQLSAENFEIIPENKRAGDSYNLAGNAANANGDCPKATMYWQQAKKYYDVASYVYSIPTSCTANLSPITITTNTFPGLSLNGSSLTIQLNAGDNIDKNADWWFVAYTPWGHWFSYVYPNRWIDIGTDLSQVSPAYQGPLADVSSLTLFDTTGIPDGNYVFYFGVDTNMNGVLDYSQLYYFSLPLTINSANYAGIYSGTFSGGDSGTFNATVSANGAITGTVYSNSDHESYRATGQVSANGSLTMVAGSVSTGATFNGNINLINGNFYGSWTNYEGIGGSFSGTKNK